MAGCPNYDHCVNGIWNIWGLMNKYLYDRLIKWGRKHHSNKTKKWVFNPYWKHIDGRWTFTETSKDNKIHKLISYDLRQKKIRSRINIKTNVFDLKNKNKIRQVQLLKSNDLSYTKGMEKAKRHLSWMQSILRSNTK